MRFKFYIDGFLFGEGMSIRKLSHRSGVARSYLRRMEQDYSDANPSLRVMQKIADVLKTDVSELFVVIRDEQDETDLPT